MESRIRLDASKLEAFQVYSPPAEASPALGMLQGRTVSAEGLILIKADATAVAAGTAIFRDRETGAVYTGSNVSATALDALMNGNARIHGENGEITSLDVRSVRVLDKEEYAQLAHVYIVYQNSIQALLDQQKADDDKKSLQGRVTVGDPNPPFNFPLANRVTLSGAKDRDDKLRQVVGGEFSRSVQSKKTDTIFAGQAMVRTRNEQTRQNRDVEKSYDVKNDEERRSDNRTVDRTAQQSGVPKTVTKRRRRSGV